MSDATPTDIMIAEDTNRFAAQLARHSLALRRAPLEVLQVNVGRLCNQTCRHCHVNAGPTRTELMTAEVAAHCVRLLDEVPTIRTLDITGGAPEMSPPFRDLVRAGRTRGLRVIDRCNLTILSQPGQEDLADFLAEQRVDIVASLPCYTPANVDRQRGDGVFAASINGLRMLNGRGFGRAEGAGDANGAGLSADPPRRLDLVYNPLGPNLPPAQAALEADYRARLRDDFGVVFDRLITITNMPIGRFRSDLIHAGRLDEYVAKLDAAFNPAVVAGVMCRTFLSVDHEGWLYDCDFNQMLALPLGAEAGSGRRRNIADLHGDDLVGAAIATGDHCLGCTAGCGSSCGGALA